jgi:transcriptional regulator of acetoin/glycerol metabolism
VPAPPDTDVAEENLPEFHTRPPLSFPPLKETEKSAIMEALKRSGGDRGKAAQLLGIGRTTLYRKLKEYRIQN